MRRFLIFSAFVTIALVGIAAWRIQAIVRDSHTRLDEAHTAWQSQVGDLDLAAHRPEPVEDGIAPRVRDAISRLDLTSADRALLKASRSAESTDPEPIEALLARQRPALEAVRHASRASGQWLDDEPNPGAALVTMTTDFVRLAELLRLDGAQALRDGDTELALEDLRTLRRLAGSLRSEPFLVPWLQARVFDEAACRVARTLAENPRCGVDCLAAGRSIFEDTVRWKTPDHALIGEALIGHRAATASLPAEEKSTWHAIVGPIRHAERRREHAALLDDWRQLIHWSAEAGPADRNPPDTGGPIASMMIPNIVDGVHKARRLRAASRLARLALAARAHEQLHGEWPSAPALAAELPPWDGTALTVDATSGGGLRLAAPEVLEALAADAHRPEQGDRETALFDWYLAPSRS